MQAIVDPVYYKRTVTISPGVVGSVGDVISGVRLKQSNPDMPMRYEKEFSGREAAITGSNVQDGFSYSYSSGGGPPRTLEFSLASRGYPNRGFKTVHGWRYQDLRAPDTTLEPVMGSTGRYDWYNKIATVYEAKRTGDLFLPLPGPYGPTNMTRGSQVPRITDVISPTDLYTNIGDTRNPPSDAKQILSSAVKKIIGYNCTDAQGKVTYKTLEQLQAQKPSVVTNEDRASPANRQPTEQEMNLLKMPGSFF